MKIAIATENGRVAQHFGRCAEYTIVDIEDSSVTGKTLEPNPGHAPGAIPKFLHDKGCDLIICGGMGGRAQEFFRQFDMEYIIGVQCSVDEAIEGFISGSLAGGESTCDHGEGKGDGTGRDHGCGH